MKAAQWLAGVAFAGLAAVAAALVSQYRFDIQPCPWCVLQRVIYVAIALACLLGLVWRSTWGRRIGAGLGLLLALGGAAAALWQHFVAAASASCNLTLADKIVSRWLHLDTALPSVFEARASCADAAVNLLGVPYDVWSLALFVLMALALWRVLSTAGRR
ncbi:MAG: disulfide bond formation protein B [Burkholderiales bacterium]|nr:disulfide bond formation protein B [Burkholderiales bacterium]MDE2626660.1 disulfide bond formation protein B [Burkholderiales bacterium]